MHGDLQMHAHATLLIPKYHLGAPRVSRIYLSPRIARMAPLVVEYRRDPGGPGTQATTQTGHHVPR